MDGDGEKVVCSADVSTSFRVTLNVKYCDYSRSLD